MIGQARGADTACVYPFAAQFELAAQFERSIGSISRIFGFN